MLRIVFLFVMRIGQGMVLPIRKCKDSERRVQKQMGNEVSRIDSAEPPPIFAYSAKIANYLGIAEYLILKKRMPDGSRFLREYIRYTFL